MRWSLSLIAVTVVVTADLSSQASAARLFNGRLFRRAQAVEPEEHVEMADPEYAEPEYIEPGMERPRVYWRPMTHPGNVYDYYRTMWPKYFGGFHERHWSTYGRVNGDLGRGLRGSAW